MRTHSLICGIVILASAANGGQPTRQAVQGLMTTHIASRQLSSAVNVHNPILKKWVEERMAAAPAAPNHLMQDFKDGLHTFSFDRERARLTNAAIQKAEIQASRIAPFDTVYEQGFYGPRRYVYLHDLQGNTLQKSTQIKSTNGWEETERIVRTYTAAGHLEQRTGYATSYGGTISSREYRTYDTQGDRTASRTEFFDLYSGIMLGYSADSSSYDIVNRSGIYQWEWWQEGGTTQGSREEYSNSDTGGVSTTSVRTVDGWTPLTRRSYFATSQDTCQYDLIESWNGSRWVNTTLTAQDIFTLDPDVLSTTWTWQEKDWALASRERRVCGEEMQETLTERWTGECWIPAARHSYLRDTQGQTAYEKLEFWDNGWHPDNAYAYGYGSDGSFRQIDTSWIEGSLNRVNDITYDQAFSLVASKYEDWRSGILVWGASSEITSTASGHDAESVSCTWIDGRWEQVDRYTFLYDEHDRLISLNHAYHDSVGWVDSFRSSRWDTNGGPGSSWDLDHAAWDRQDRDFNGFSELTFVYRSEVSGLAQEHNALPVGSALHQNYPNPFNPVTTIPFSVATGARTTVVIFDVLGREVARPVDAWKDPGEYRAEFDANGLASGMYICRFSSGTVSQTRKLMLVR